jgi:hypothetical protein
MIATLDRDRRRARRDALGPGLLLVTGGLLAKTLIDRSLRPRDARRRGDRQLAAQARRPTTSNA